MLLRSTVFSYCVARHRWTAFSLRAPEMCLGTQYGCDDALHQWTMFSFCVTLHWRSTISFRAPERALGLSMARGRKRLLKVCLATQYSFRTMLHRWTVIALRSGNVSWDTKWLLRRAAQVDGVQLLRRAAPVNDDSALAIR